MLSPYLVELDTEMLRLNCFRDNFVSLAPFLVTFSLLNRFSHFSTAHSSYFFTFVIKNDLHTNLSIFSAKH